MCSLGNLCVDIELPVPALPNKATGEASRLATSLVDGMQGTEHMELGGAVSSAVKTPGGRGLTRCDASQCNVLVASSRMGLRAAAIGTFTADDPAGRFLRQELEAEGVELQASVPGTSGRGTLHCAIFVTPGGDHCFASIYDDGPWPIFSDATTVGRRALETISGSRALVLNGFALDEFPEDTLFAMAEDMAAKELLFDPGPRIATLRASTARKRVLERLLQRASAACFTVDEFDELVPQPSRSLEAKAGDFCREFMEAGEWLIVKAGGEGAHLVVCGEGGRPTLLHHPGFAVRHGALGVLRLDSADRGNGVQVTVADTVGCGDSFAAGVLLGRLRPDLIPAEVCLTVANAIGAATAERSSAGRNVATLERVKAILGEAGETRALEGLGKWAQASQALTR